ncbi:MAG: argininosuccinate lyase [Flavobacteriaceae bacterium]|nr:argininosuccinate lyase [Flavobacteriaceae bacterium]
MKIWQKSSTQINQDIDKFTVGEDRHWDMRLAMYDIKASKAHADMLGHVGLLTKDEVDSLNKGLDDLLDDIEKGVFVIEDTFEDMHSKIEYELTQKLGEVGKKIHTARSRNDQVLVALQLYFKDEIKAIKALSKELFEVLIDLADTHKDVLLPGYTHLQIAMPSSFGLWFSAYAESLTDDMTMLNAAYTLCDQNPLGSAAGYGSSFPIDRVATTKALQFSDMKVNVVAAQMARGKIEKNLAFGISNLASTLSRFSMDVCLYMSQNFNFLTFPQELTTGSSIMPHKKNPDVFELIRGKCNALQALPNQMAMMLTNLPSGYHREMQLFKGPILKAIDEIKDCLQIATFSIKQVQVRTNILDDSKYDYLFSVDTLNEMVQEGIPFRDAYKKIGDAIESGDYNPSKTAKHTHVGSLGNLDLKAIRKKFDSQY